MSDRRWVVAATGNPHKLRELRRLLAAVAEVASLDEAARDTPGGGALTMPEETGDTFADNAILKAVAISRLTPRAVLADDSGLCVDFLDGRPGVHSARHGGPGLSDRERYELLLKELKGVPDVYRGAHYRAAVAIARDGRLLSLHEGTCHGAILHEPVGEGGFGYDPIFLVTSLGCTMAQLTPEQKDAVSHRARAMTGAALALTQALADEG